MAFIPNPSRKKREALYKTVYLSKELRDKIERIAKAYDTSFNNVVVSMLEECLRDTQE